MRRLIFKVVLVLLFVSGVVLMDQLAVKWELYRVLQPLHIAMSLLFIPLFMVPFIRKHIRYYYLKKGVKSPNGWLVLAAFVLVTLSGIYLLLVGNRGGDAVGIASFWTHLLLSFALVLFFLWHIARPAVMVMLLLFLPDPSLQAEEITPLSRMQIVNGDAKDFHSKDFTNSTRCKECHADIFNQWADSNHRHMVGSNRYYMVMETLAGEVEGEEFRQWCMSCHNPSGLAIGLEKTTHGMSGNVIDGESYEVGSVTLQRGFTKHDNFRVEEGVSCVSCHLISEATHAGNASYTIDLDRKKYALEDSRYTLAKKFSDLLVNAKPEVHKESYSKDFYRDSRYCASCHDEQHPKNGIKIVATYEEWSKSEYNNPQDPSKHKSCIDCHMTYLEGGKFSPLKGRSTDGGAIKDDVKVHYFAGSNYFLTSLRNHEAADQTIQLLKTAAKLDLGLSGSELVVGVTNSGAGHHLPTGVADFRELWLEVEVSDANGKVVLSSGKLDENGEIEKGSRIFHKVFGDDEGKPVGLLFWKYKTMLKDTRIPAKQRREERFVLPEGLAYPLKASVKLNFRIYPQWVSDAVLKSFSVLPNPDILTLNSLEKEFKRSD